MAVYHFNDERVADLDISREDVDDFSAKGVDFADLDAEAATVRKGTVTDCSFRGGSFENASLLLTLVNCTFRAVNLRGIAGTKFNACRFEGSQMCDFSGVDYSDCVATGCVVERAVSAALVTKSCKFIEPRPKLVDQSRTPRSLSDSTILLRHVSDYGKDCAPGVLKFALYELEKCQESIIRAGRTHEAKALQLRRKLMQKRAFGLAPDERTVLRYFLNIDRGYTSLVCARFETISAQTGIQREDIERIVETLRRRGFVSEYIVRPPVDAVCINYEFEV